MDTLITKPEDQDHRQGIMISKYNRYFLETRKLACLYSIL